jgi:hypothetical protein
MARTMPWLVSLLVIPLLAQAAESAPTQPVPWHPCARIAAACTQAGFVRNGAKIGAGIMVDCIQPIIAGTPQRKQATKALPQIDPQVVAACNTRAPNFGKGRPREDGHVEVRGDGQRRSNSAKMRQEGLR